MSALRIIGAALALFGVVASISPSWFTFLTGPEPGGDIFEAVERRVRAGMVLGAGLGFIAVTSLRPFSVSIPTWCFWLVLGALVARMYGLVVDGVTAKQWLLVAVEAAIMAAIAGWLWWKAKG